MSLLESKLIFDNSQLWQVWQSNPQARPLADRIKSGCPVRLIGPCAAQTEDQVEAILSVTADHCDGVRVPDKKPRTRPVKPDGSPIFLGIGHHDALKIYESINKEHPNLPICVETMSDKDICVLASRGILGLAWSGSRTQEQESLQRLGGAARETNTPMMVKNPLAPDDEFYLGMMENWIIGAGNAVPVLACVRGHTPYTSEQKSQWRNPPNISLISALRKSFPDLPIMVHLMLDGLSHSVLKSVP